MGRGMPWSLPSLPPSRVHSLYLKSGGEGTRHWIHIRNDQRIRLSRRNFKNIVNIIWKKYNINAEHSSSEKLWPGFAESEHVIKFWTKVPFHYKTKPSFLFFVSTYGCSRWQFTWLMEIHKEITSLRGNTDTKKMQSANIWLETLMITKMVSKWLKNIIILWRTGENCGDCHLVDPSAIASAVRTRHTVFYWVYGPQQILLKKQQSLIREILQHCFKK